jgi:DNA-binding Lrp family transcriptional regulator
MGQLTKWKAYQEVIAMTTRAYVLITTEVGKAIEVAEQLRPLPGVQAADVVTGTYDVVLVLETGNTSDIGRLVLTQIHGTSGLKGTMTLMAVT